MSRPLKSLSFGITCDTARLEEVRAVLLHQSIHALGSDRSTVFGTPPALNEGGDPTVAVGGTLVDKTADLGGQFEIAAACLRAPWTRSAMLNRATPSVSMTTFIGKICNQPSARFNGVNSTAQ